MGHVLGVVGWIRTSAPTSRPGTAEAVVGQPGQVEQLSGAMAPHLSVSVAIPVEMGSPFCGWSRRPGRPGRPGPRGRPGGLDRAGSWPCRPGAGRAAPGRPRLDVLEAHAEPDQPLVGAGGPVAQPLDDRPGELGQGPAARLGADAVHEQHPHRCPGPRRPSASELSGN
jgi:hypothetical protein